MAQEKEYTGSFTMGATTPSYDLETKPENFKDYSLLTEESIKAFAAEFTGEILQIPPIHSAIKKEGKRAYEFARSGKHIELEPRKITIKEFEIVSVNLPLVHFRVVCSTGTYIRSLANDIGIKAGCGAYLSSLCRTRIGNFTLDQSISVEEFVNKIKPGI